MPTVHFKNRQKTNISREIFQIIVKKIGEGSAKKIEMFTTPEKETVLVINIEEIVFITA